MLGFPYLFAAHTRCPNALQKHELSPKSSEFLQFMQYTLFGISVFSVLGAACFFAIKLVIIYHHQFILFHYNALSGQFSVKQQPFGYSFYCSYSYCLHFTSLNITSCPSLRCLAIHSPVSSNNPLQRCCLWSMYDSFGFPKSHPEHPPARIGLHTL